MKKTVLTALLTLSAVTFAAPSAFAAPTDTMQVYASDGGDLQYSSLSTESAWMAIEVPLSLLGGRVPADLSLAVTGLPSGTTIALDSVSQDGDMALLHVTVSRADTSVMVNNLADIALNSGGQTLATVSIPVLGAAVEPESLSW